MSLFNNNSQFIIYKSVSSSNCSLKLFLIILFKALTSFSISLALSVSLYFSNLAFNLFNLLLFFELIEDEVSIILAFKLLNLDTSLFHCSFKEALTIIRPFELIIFLFNNSLQAQIPIKVFPAPQQAIIKALCFLKIKSTISL